MTKEQLLDALQRLMVETGSLACLGCGHEHNCSLQGCSILREAVAALREQEERRWIPVTERLPERTMPPHDVLVYHDLNCGMFIDRAWYSHEKNKWRSAVGMNLKVTHWMPLLEPPKGE